MFKKISNMKKEKINDEKTKLLLFDLKKENDNKYTYVSNQNAFTKILKQKNEKNTWRIIKNKISTSYQFATKNTSNCKKKMYNQNIENQYTTTKKSSFSKEKSKKEKKNQHKNLN